MCFVLFCFEFVTVIWIVSITGAMNTKNSILNALLQQAIYKSQQTRPMSTSPAPVNLSMSSSFPSNDDASSNASSCDEDEAADLSSRRSLTPPTSHLHAAMAAAFSFQRDLITQQQLQHQQQQQQQQLQVQVQPPQQQQQQQLEEDVPQSHLVAKALASATMRRPRSEKKPIPDDLKDMKYYERRRRNNLAAKRSRDMRKNREDQVTVRANYLEKENSILRAQVATLRDEAFALKQMLLHKQATAILRSQTAAS